MNMNTLGKSLVLVHTTLSLVALAWAAGLFLQFRDFGWAEPRLQLEQRVASEYDKRTVALAQARASARGTVKDMKNLIDDLHAAREKFASNQLLYRAELQRLRAGVAKDGKGLAFKKPRIAGGSVELEKGPAYNPPKLDDPLLGITNSYEGYKKELAAVEAKIKTEIKKGQDWTLQHAVISDVLNGAKDDKGEAYPGLYALMEEEKRSQDAAKKELDYLQNVWAPALQEAQIFVQRRARLQKTLDDLRKSRSKGK